MKLPKLILTDIDGVWTDGGMYYGDTNIELKKFNTSDSAGVLFCKLLNIPVGIITGENTTIVKKRADKLNVDYLFLGIKNKKKVIGKLIEKLNISWQDVAYIGDDLNDMELLQLTGISATPHDAPKYIKKIAKYNLKKNGGEGVFREFVELILGDEYMKIVLEKYLENLNAFKQ